MEKSFLFFDIECANCFNGEGKICSFGYVLTDGDFNILDSDDVVMNPETEFDWYLFSPKNKCPLAYSKDYFRSKPNFEAFYSNLKKLIEFPGRSIIGFGSENDMGFLVYTCQRYGLNQFNFSVYDMADFVNDFHKTKKGLTDWCDFYKIERTNLKAHRSCDDAMMTMLLTKTFCKEQKLFLEDLLLKNKGKKLSIEKYMEIREKRLHDKENSKKIESLYGKKSKVLYSNILAGNSYSLGFKINSDSDEALRIAELIYKNGGILFQRLKNSGTVVFKDEDLNSQLSQNLSKKGLKTIDVSSLQALLYKK